MDFSSAGAPPDDADLARRARGGEPAAYGELVRRHQTAVFNVCLRLLGHRQEAEDAAQEAFLRAYERLETFDLSRPFGPWIRRVAANHCLNRLAGERPAGLALDDETAAAAEPGPEAASEHADQAQALRAALAALPASYRAVIELRHFQELSYDEIAAALDLPLSDVKSRLFRARRRLAERLKDRP